MMQPKRTKYRKPHRTRYDGKAKGNKYVAFGEYGLMATEGNWITDKQLESLRVVLSKAIGTIGKIWIRVFPQLLLTRKPTLQPLWGTFSIQMNNLPVTSFKCSQKRILGLVC